MKHATYNLKALIRSVVDMDEKHNNSIHCNMALCLEARHHEHIIRQVCSSKCAALSRVHDSYIVATDGTKTRSAPRHAKPPCHARSFTLHCMSILGMCTLVLSGWLTHQSNPWLRKNDNGPSKKEGNTSSSMKNGVEEFVQQRDQTPAK